MFGIGMARAYEGFSIDLLGGASAALLVSLATRLLVGIGWYRLFERAGIKGYLAFIPIVGPYNAFRLVWDDFSLAAIFGATTFVAWVNAVGVEHPIVGAFAVVNFILWWALALLSTRAYGTGMFLGFLYGGLSWLGVPLMGFWSRGSYQGAWSSDPEADQNLTPKERKKRRKKAAKKAKRTR